MPVDIRVSLADGRDVADIRLAQCIERAALLEADAALGYRLKPRLAVSVGDDFYCTDERGLRRNPARHHEIAADIMIVGDSQAFAAHLAWGETFAGVVEAKSGLSVVNASVPGYNPVCMALSLRKLRTLNPRVILWVHNHCHPDWAVSLFSPFVAFPLISVPHLTVDRRMIDPEDNGPAFAEAEAYRRGDGSWAERFVMAQAFHERYGARKAADPGAVVKFCRDMANGHVCWNHVDVLVVAIPKYRKSPIPPSDWLAAFAPWRVLDLQPILDGIDGLASPDGHLSAKAHGLIADAILEAI